MHHLHKTFALTKGLHSKRQLRNSLWWLIYHGNWTEWSTIWAEIIRVISKSNRCTARRVRFLITSMISDQNCTTRGLITTLSHPFLNRLNTGLSQFKYFIDTVLSQFKIKFIHFGGGGGNKSFGNKSCKICRMIPFVFHFPAIWLVALNKPWNLIVCFVFSAASSLAGKKMRFKAKNGATRE